MADPTAREAKLIQYLNEAYGKEKQLETALQAQIALAQKPLLKKRLKDHLKETKAQSRNIERRVKALGGKAETTAVPGPDVAAAAAGKVASAANKAIAAAKGPVQTLRGTGPADNQLRNVRDCFWNEAEEIAHYVVLEAAADALGDKETAKLARDHRRQEERMQRFLEKQIPTLVRDVIKEEIPAKDRKPAASTPKRRTTAKDRKPAASTPKRRTTARAAARTGGRRRAA